MPDHFIDVLADPTCSKDDITSKEILKRFGGKVNGGRGVLHDASHEGHLQRPLARRVETDPEPRPGGWQEPNAPFAQPSQPSTPPQKWKQDDVQPSPWGTRSFDGPDTEERQRAWRNSAQGRPGNSVDVGGSG